MTADARHAPTDNAGHARDLHCATCRQAWPCPTATAQVHQWQAEVLAAGYPDTRWPRNR